MAVSTLVYTTVLLAALSARIVGSFVGGPNYVIPSDDADPCRSCIAPGNQENYVHPSPAMADLGASASPSLSHINLLNVGGAFCNVVNK